MLKKINYPLLLCLSWLLFSCLLLIWNSGKLKDTLADDSDLLKKEQPVPLAASPYGNAGTGTKTKKVVFKNDKVRIDATNVNNGYLMVAYSGKSSCVKLLFSGPGGQAYTYTLSPNKGYEVFPLTCGSGSYHLTIYESIDKNQYASIISKDFEVDLENEYLPFLYPNQYVNYNKNSQVIKIAKKLAKNTSSEIEFIGEAYNYVVENISYDSKAAESVTYGYLPEVDHTIKTKKGICFDYAALLTALLRSQGIPTRLEIGYTDNIYHAWVRVYLREDGWISKDIHAQSGSWKLLDPTFAANSEDNKDILRYIGNGDNYHMKYTY